MNSLIHGRDKHFVFAADIFVEANRESSIVWGVVSLRVPDDAL